MMSFFQIAGHVFSSMAIARVPVSTVHTIKVRCSAFPSGDGIDKSRTGPLAPFHRRLLCPPLPRSLLFSHLPLPPAADAGRHAGVLFRSSGERHGPHLRSGLDDCLRLAEHFLEEGALAQSTNARCLY